ncbi:MAG: ABC transporter ATP-binding protein [Anaerolineales bacterium]
MTFALETHDIKKVYSSGNLTVTAVENVSLGVRPGEFVALVGPSGSGKTSLLAILAGLLAPTAGKVLIDGHNLVNMSDKARTQFRKEKIGFTFQANNLIPYLTALENVELMLRLNGKNGKQGRKRAQELLERLGLGERLNNLPGQLSGGQQQRVAIARALVHDPAVVLADEPTASLDTERAFQVVETFASLIHEQNRAGIMVTHDLRMVKYVDTVIQMVDGHVAYILRDRVDIDAMAGNSQYSPPRLARPELVPMPQNTSFVTGFPTAVPLGAGD